VSGDAPAASAERGPSGGEVRALGVAALGGTLALLASVLVGQVLALVGSVAIGIVDAVAWAKLGLLTALLALRGELEATAGNAPFLDAAGVGSFRWRLMPSLLTILFLWLASRAGRRVARDRPGRSAAGTIALAAAGAGVAVAALAALAAALVTVSDSGLDLLLEVSPTSAALWGGILAAAGAGVGAFLEACAPTPAARATRGAIEGYVLALGLALVAFLVVATLEPRATRAYVDALRGMGSTGAAVAGAHVLVLPTQSALLLVPASGSCLDVVAGRSGAELCPWRVSGLGVSSALSPWFWLLNAVPIASAAFAGWRAGRGLVRRSAALATGASAGLFFGVLAVLGAAIAAPRWFLPAPIPISAVSLGPRWVSTILALLAWGALGGALGGWLAGRSYAEDPVPPIPTSA
jgi:uncharacterized protein DUF6350